MDERNRRALVLGATLVILGIILSGPPLVLLVGVLKPQPPWVDASTLAAHYHWLQTLPYWFGFLLLAGNVLFVAAAGRLPDLGERVNPTLALVSVAIYGALVSVNYLVQVAYVPQAATLPGEIVAALSMVNPASMAWLVEMFSYAFLGVAMWLVAPGFRGSSLLDAVRWLLVVDGIVSLVAVVLSAISLTWVLTQWGLLAYAAWNLLVVVAMALVILAFRQQSSSE